MPELSKKTDFENDLAAKKNMKIDLMNELEAIKLRNPLYFYKGFCFYGFWSY